MRYHWGCAVGHVYCHPTPPPPQPQTQTETRSQDAMDGNAMAEQQLCSDTPDALEVEEEEANEVSDDEQERCSDFGIDEGGSEDSEGDGWQSSEEEYLEEMEMYGEDQDLYLTSYD
jgi:hypothetical protein